MIAAWSLLLGACSYVVAHFALYLMVARHLPAFRKEYGIFLYHAVAFAALAISAVAACVTAASPDVLQASIGALALHAIYSMSFLEAWSLSQISYSIAILDAIEARPNLGAAALTSRFADEGTAKKASRLSTLQSLRLIVLENDRATLTPRGRVVASGLQALRWIAPLREAG